MRHIKNYGHTTTTLTARHLRTREDPKTDTDYTAFVETHDTLIIAHWISVMDKIARKPKGTAKASQEQMDFRRKLGAALWAKLCSEKKLPGLNGPDKEKLETLWGMKVAPYPDDAEENEKILKKLETKGRWYERFAGDVEPMAADVTAIANCVYDHLYVKELRLNPNSKLRRKGRIERSAESIQKSIKPTQGTIEDQKWDEADFDRYFQDDVSAKIYQKAKAKEQDKQPIHMSIAGKALHARYATLFIGDDGKVLKITEADKRHPGLFALHMAVKDAYKRTIKGRQKVQLHQLPQNAQAMKRRLNFIRDNRTTSAQLRRGRVMHFKDQSENTDTSPLWTSDGQTDIKRTEAFIRVWRHTITMAAATLRDWIDPDLTQKGDILLEKKYIAACDTLNCDSFRSKAPLLFGDAAAPIDALSEEQSKAFAHTTAKALAKLRNLIFHFKTREDVFKALDKALKDADQDSLAVYTAIHQDAQNRQKQILDRAIIGCKAPLYLNGKVFKRCLDLLNDQQTNHLPLPRFRRVLQRVEHAWVGKQDTPPLALPLPHNRDFMEQHPAARSQYVMLGLLYEMPFRVWLADQPNDTIKRWLTNAIDRTTTDARKINAKKGKQAEQDLIVAKAAKLVQNLDQGHLLSSFFHTLSAETAVEMRVQNGYTSDSAQARKQAGYIEDLKCDLMALAFDAFLNTKNLQTLGTLDPDTEPRKDKLEDFKNLTHINWPHSDTPQHQTDPKLDVLFTLLHLASVQDVGRLLHQMRKWDILAGNTTRTDIPGQAFKRTQDHHTRVNDLMDVMVLYTSLHRDAFTGTEELQDPEDFQDWYENPRDIDKVFKNPEQHAVLPVRGLREVQRHGHLRPLRPLFEKNKIPSATLTEWQGLSNEIAEAYQTREEKHSEWVQKKTKIDPETVQDYVAALRTVIRHRHLTADVTLTMHLRVHQLMMTVVGRLIDFAGLWERDLTYIFNHHIQAKNININIKTQNLLDEGQIIKAIRNAKLTSVITNFDEQDEKGQTKAFIRNTLAHMDFVRQNTAPNLTHMINDTRKLLVHDRKLKNAVVPAITALLERENLTITWDTRNHDMVAKSIQSLTADHLGGLKVTHPAWPKKKKGQKRVEDRRRITEALHSDLFVHMVAQLFAAKAIPVKDCTSWSESDILGLKR